MPTPAVRLVLPRAPLFVGTYHRVPVSIVPAAAIAFDDLEFVIPAGLGAGEVSASRDSRFDPARPAIMLLAGYAPGKYRIEVRDRRTHAPIVQQPFEVTGLWTDPDAGPSFWFSGPMDAYAVGLWGGGPAGPQNLDVHAAPATWRLAAVMVDFTDQLYSTDPTVLQGFRDLWFDNIVTGVNVLGATRSVKAYYDEVSYGQFDLQFTRADLYGPVHLPGTWKTYYHQIASPDGRWLVSDWQALVTGVQGALDLSRYDAVLFIPHKGASGPGDQQGLIGGALTTVPRFAWGVSTLGKRPFTTNQGDLAAACMSMSNEWQSFAGASPHAGLVHELGHTLGLEDQYFNPGALQARKVDLWDPMASGDDGMPDFCLAHRMMLGWVAPASIRTFDFAQAIAPVDQVVTLGAAEAVPPPAVVGIEVRIADGLNYYFEYRKSQAGQSGDQLLQYVRDNVVLGTDVASSPPVNTRANILSLAGRPTGMGNGEGYTENSVANTAWPGTFNADVSGITGTRADVRIRYGVNAKPDPAIRPWPASPSREWQSPDVEVTNLRSMQDAAWFNVPWLGHSNTVVATITNRGNVPAPQVRADFFTRDYSVTNAPEVFLATASLDLPAGAARQFTAPWTPSVAGHFCIVVRIPPYTTPTPPILDELTGLNNLAQSNYDRFISATGSPARRVVTSVAVYNPYAARTRLFVCPAHDNPLYRTYVGHTWLDLDAGETRSVEVMFEYGPVDEVERDGPRFGAANLRRFASLPNAVNVVGIVQDPGDPHVLHVAGGAQVQVVKGKETRIDGLAMVKDVMRGEVVVAATGKPVPRGTVLVTCWSGHGKTRKELACAAVGLRRGVFEARIAAKWTELEAYFLPPKDYADCVARLEARTRKVVRRGSPRPR